MTQSSNGRAFELIDELRETWNTDVERAAEILGELQAVLDAGGRDRGWARNLRERLRREHKEREKRELGERESND